MNAPDSMLYVGIALAVLVVLFPHAAWYFNESWKSKEGAKPSAAYIFLTRLSGIVGLIVIIVALRKGHHTP